MKKLLGILLLFINLVCVSGCGDKVDFGYFKKHVDSIKNYRYYVISEEIYNNELLLYKKDKNVYLDGEKYRIVLNTKEINDIEADDLYNQTEEEFYKKGSDFYYKENGVWKIKQVETNETVGFNLKKNMFSTYEISKKDKNVFTGELKADSINEFLGFEITNVSNMALNIEISKKDKVEKVALEYLESNGNKVVVSITVGYQYLSRFELPTVE